MPALFTRVLRFIWNLILWGLVLFVLLLCGGFIALRFGLTNVPGAVDEQAETFNHFASVPVPLLESVEGRESVPLTLAEYEQLCILQIAAQVAPANAAVIAQVYRESGSFVLLTRMLQALRLRLQDDLTYQQGLADCSKQEGELDLGADPDLLLTQLAEASGETVYSWISSAEWATITAAISKDREQIEQAAEMAQVPARTIVAVAIVEQLRLYHTQRELFERVFKPLTLLGNATKMAWGTMAIKEHTAIATEDHLRDRSSPFYLGNEKEHLLDFPEGVTEGTERYRRLTNDRDHTYSYRYGALYLAQVTQQWERAGYPIEDRPEILATLYNIGFANSKPKANPQVGGSRLKIGSTEYSFGALAYEFYYSGELREIFPYPQPRY